MATKQRELRRADLDALGLEEHPFRISADTRYYYRTDQHKSILRRLEDTISWHEGLAVIEGEIGTGKTIIARILYAILSDKEMPYWPVYIHTGSYKTSVEAAKDISSAFGLPRKKQYSDQLRVFESFIIQSRTEDGVDPVLIIDDANRMAPEALGCIQDFLNFDVTEKQLQIILFGQPDIHHNFLEQRSLVDRVIYWQKIGPLPYDEMVGLIKFRLDTAGRETALFSDSALRILYDHAEGIPRPLIVACNETLRVLLDQDKTFADKKEVEQAIKTINQRPKVR